MRRANGDPAGLGELDRGAHHVEQNLADAFRISSENLGDIGGEFDLECQSLLHGARLHQAGNAIEQAIQTKIQFFDFEAPCLDLR